MSRYCIVKTEFKDGTALIVALAETGGWTAKQVEIHHEPQHLYGFEGDVRKEKAHIIIRRIHVGRNSNDLGFIRGEDGNYEAIISDYDSKRYGKEWMKQLKGNYAYHKVRKDMVARGRRVSRIQCENGHQQVVITGYR